MLLALPAFSLRPQTYKHVIYLFGVRHTYHNTHVEVKGSLPEPVPSFHHVGLGIEERSSGLTASTIRLAHSPAELSQQLGSGPLRKLRGLKNSLTCPVQLLAVACIAWLVVLFHVTTTVTGGCHSHYSLWLFCLCFHLAGRTFVIKASLGARTISVAQSAG